MDRIAPAERQQTASIEKIYKNAEEISGVVRTSTASAQESASSSEELTKQAKRLLSLISRFQAE